MAEGRGRLLRGRSGFALDEYVGLPPGHPQSYREVLLREVCAVVGLPAGAAHVPDGSGRDVADARRGGRATTSADRRRRGGVDVQILGIGANGHLGFNEPGSALTSRTRVKRLSERTRRDNARFFHALDDVPTHCVTQGLGTVLDARRLVLVATGDAKADAVAAALEGPLTASVPASVLQWHADTVVCSTRRPRPAAQPRLLRRCGERAPGLRPHRRIGVDGPPCTVAEQWPRRDGSATTSRLQRGWTHGV